MPKIVCLPLSLKKTPVWCRTESSLLFVLPIVNGIPPNPGRDVCRVVISVNSHQSSVSLECALSLSLSLFLILVIQSLFHNKMQKPNNLPKCKKGGKKRAVWHYKMPGIILSANKRYYNVPNTSRMRGLVRKNVRYSFFIYGHICGYNRQIT